MKRVLFGLTCYFLASSPATVIADTKRAMTIDDLFRIQRVADPQISPDGKTVVYVLTSVDPEGNKSKSNLWLADDKSNRQLTTTEKKDRHPRWRPDGK